MTPVVRSGPQRIENTLSGGAAVTVDYERRLGSGGHVIGLAPSAAAAAQIREATGAAETLAKLTWSIEHGDLPGWAHRIGQSTLVIIDEARMADTLPWIPPCSSSSAAAPVSDWSVMINNSPRSALAVYCEISKRATVRSD